MSNKLKLVPVPESNWGFQPLEALFECWDQKEEERFGVLYKTYRNEPGFNPGKPIWVYAIDEKGGWALTSEISLDDLKEKVLKIRHPEKPSKKK